MEKNTSKMAFWITILFLISTTKSVIIENTQEANPGCLNLWVGFCEICYLRKFDGNYCSKELAPESDPCLIHKKKHCAQCKEGYSLDLDNGNRCVVSGIKVERCHAMQIFEGNEICTICKDGLPSEDGKECLDFSRDLRNCEYGRRTPSGDARCRRCKDGLIWDISHPASCTRNERNSGCMSKYFYGHDECQICDYLGGYNSMNPNENPKRRCSKL
jgi:hypothetical protein